jgi:hypothetical protein
MNRLTTLLSALALGLVGLGVFIVLLPVMIICAPFNYYFDWRREEKLKKYLLELGDKNFFCYNDRTDAKDFIEKKVIPMLDKEVELIYLDGREPKSKYIKDNISLVLYKFKNYTRFPHLLKVRGGQIIDESINNEFFNTLSQNKPVDNLVGKIHRFFDLRAANKP